MADSSLLRASGSSRSSWPLPDAPDPPVITTFLLQFLTGSQVVQIKRQFFLSLRRNKQVMWTGNNRKEAQEWADQRSMRTLSTAMGPLQHGDDPRCFLPRNDQKRRSQYMRGASALFAWCVTTDDIVTILCPPPPDRFNPGGATNMQLVELPILTGIAGGQAVSRIDVIHPMVHGAEDFRYQLWPVDEVHIWIHAFAEAGIPRTLWLQRARTPQVQRIENFLRSLSRDMEENAICHAILPKQGSTGAAMVEVAPQVSQQKGNILGNNKKAKGRNLDYGGPSTTQPKASKGKQKNTKINMSGSAPTSEGEKAKKPKLQQQAPGKKKKTKVPSGTGKGVLSSAEGKAKKPSVVSAVPQSKASKKAATGAEKVLVGGGSSLQKHGIAKSSKKRSGKKAATEGLTAAKRSPGEAKSSESTETAANTASAPANNTEIDKIPAQNKVKKTKCRGNKKGKNKETQFLQGSWMPSIYAPGQTTCRCTICRGDRASLRRTASPSVQSDAAWTKPNALLTVTIEKLRKQSTEERASRLIWLSGEYSRAEVCLQSAQTSLFVIPTASCLALERSQSGRT
ncbi:hypothetical protein AUP68_18114 [Ilyonectria robusta]